MSTVEVDLHGLHPQQIAGLVLQQIVEHAWKSGAARLMFIHGHGHHRGGAVRQGSGELGSRVRSWLQRDRHISHFIRCRSIDCRNPGVTTVELHRNPKPEAASFDVESILPPTHYEKVPA
jgi:hypothetical protein